MKHVRIAFILAIIVVMSIVILFFFMPFPTASSHEARQLPLLIINNQDASRTHSVNVSVVNISGMIIFEQEYVMEPKERITSDIPAPDSNEDYLFRIAVDRKNVSEALLNMSPTHVAVIELNPDYTPEGISFSIIDVTPSRPRSGKPG